MEGEGYANKSTLLLGIIFAQNPKELLLLPLFLIHTWVSPKPTNTNHGVVSRVIKQ